MTNIPDGDFWALYYTLPKHIRDTAHRQYLKMRRDPRSVNLQKRCDSAVGQIWKADVNDQYRALAVREGDVFYWFWIGEHDEYMRQLDLLC